MGEMEREIEMWKCEEENEWESTNVDGIVLKYIWNFSYDVYCGGGG